MKKKIIFFAIFTLLVIILIILSFLSIKSIIKKNTSLENMDSIYQFSKDNFETVFSINKIVYFSGCNANSSINPNSTFTISNLYQYTDIAIFLNNNSNENLTAKNTLKSVSLSNINYIVSPTIGDYKLYYKNLNDFATNKLETNIPIENSLNFATSSENEIDFSTPVLYNNCANPITLSYVNSNLKNNYTLPNTTLNLSYDGSLLKSCGITLNSISCKIGFLITIVNNLDEIYTCPVTITIPLSTENSTIYDGYLKLNTETNYNFIKN